MYLLGFSLSLSVFVIKACLTQMGEELLWPILVCTLFSHVGQEG